MKPIEIAKKLYTDHVKHKVFEVQLAKYLKSSTGCVVDTPKYFAMADVIQFGDKTAWYIDTAVGNMKELMAFIPYPLPYIAFSRGMRSGPIRIYNLERFKRLAT